MHELILIEIIAMPAERSRGRHNPRVVKRKMSNFPTRARAAPRSGQVFRYEAHLRIVAPLGAPADQVLAPIAAPKKRPQSDQARKASVPAGQHPHWLEHARSWRASGLSRAAFCERYGLNPSTFHRWVARSRQSFRRPPHSRKVA